MATIRPLKRKKGEAWLLSYRDPATSKYVREPLHLSKVDAEKVRLKVESDIALGKFNIKIERPRTYTWQQLVDRFIPHSRRNKSDKTVKREKQTIKMFTGFLNGETFLKDIQKPTIETYKEQRLAAKSRRGGLIKPATVSIEMRGLKTMFNMAIEWKMIAENPVNRVSLPKKGIIKVRFLTKAEVKQLLQVVIDAVDLEFHDLIFTFLYTGARRFELLPPQFGWENINWAENRLHLKGKGLRERYIHISKALVPVLRRVEARKQDVPFRYHPDTVTHKLTKYLAEAGIEGASVHSLRKTFGSTLLQNKDKKVDIYEVSKLLGHASVKTTEEYYVDLLDSDLKETVEGLNYDDD